VAWESVLGVGSGEGSMVLGFETLWGLSRRLSLSLRLESLDREGTTWWLASIAAFRLRGL
jgi:hypothetical protein